MSVLAQGIVFDHSRSKGAARLVLLCLASYVAHEKWQRGEPPVAYPSQTTIARKCNCSRSTVERALIELQELGEIVDTRDRWHRGTVIWELALDALRTDEVLGGPANLTDPGSGADPRHGNLTDPGGADLTDPGGDLTDPGDPPDRSRVTRGVVKGVPTGKKQEGSSADALDVLNREELLDSLTAQLPSSRGRLRDQTTSAITALEATIPPVVSLEHDVWAARLGMVEPAGLPVGEAA